MGVGPPSDPRLRRALHACGIQGCPSPEPALQTSLRRRLRLGHDPTAQAGIATSGFASLKERYGASVSQTKPYARGSRQGFGPSLYRYLICTVDMRISLANFGRSSSRDKDILGRCRWPPHVATFRYRRMVTTHIQERSCTIRRYLIGGGVLVQGRRTIEDRGFGYGWPCRCDGFWLDDAKG